MVNQALVESLLIDDNIYQHHLNGDSEVRTNKLENTKCESIGSNILEGASATSFSQQSHEGSRLETQEIMTLEVLASGSRDAPELRLRCHISFQTQ